MHRLLSKAELLDLPVRHPVAAALPGDSESTARGPGYEFWSLREMQPGDPVRHIDWNTTARTGKTIIREHLADSFTNLMILYDISPSVAFGRKELLQANIAAAVVSTAVAGNNACGLILFADDVRTWIPPRMGLPHCEDILSTIVRAEPVSCRQTDLNPALHRLQDELPESLTFVLSDFLYPLHLGGYGVGSIHQGNSRHDIKAIQVLETHEKKLPTGSRGLLSLRDPESGMARILDLSRWAEYNRIMEEQRTDIRKQFTAAGIDMITLTPEEDFRQKINAMMGKQNIR